MLEPQDIDRYVRELRAMVRRAGDEDPEGFASIVRLLDAARAALPYAADRTRTQHGYSYADLAAGLGVTRQSAAERFTPRSAWLNAASGDYRLDRAAVLIRYAISKDVAAGASPHVNVEETTVGDVTIQHVEEVNV